MRRFKAVLSLFIIMAVLNSCDNGMSGNDDMNESGRIKSVNALNTGGFDLKPYFDASDRKNSAYEVKIDDFNSLCSRTYECQDATITFNKKENRVTVKNAECEIRGRKYTNISASYKYKIKAAGDNLLYLCPCDGDVKIYSDNQEIKVNDMPPFSMYISFYGFGKGRIEVSSFLNGESMISGGTYWAVN